MRFIPVDEVVQFALTVLPDADDRVAIVARQWAYHAVQEIGVGWYNKKSSEYLPVVDFSIEKPEDLVSVIDLAIFNEAGTELRHYYQNNAPKRIHPDTATIRTTIDVSEDMYYFHLSSNATTATWAKLVYYAMPLDEQGLPLIPEICQKAVTDYILYMYDVRRKAPRYQLDASHQQWLQSAAQARGRKNTPTPLQAQEIAQGGYFNSMIKRAISKVKYRF